MVTRIVEIADDRRHLSMHRGFLVVKDTEGERQEIGKVPLDDICAVIANAHGISYTNNLLVALAERGAPFVLCAANHNAVGMLLPIEGNHHQSKRIEAQIDAKQPTHKRIWAAIIKSKLEQQAGVLEAIGQSNAPLVYLSKKVRSGDPDNFEAQGAKKYWTMVFGDQFRRDQDADGLNGLLNYGYTVLRAATARSVIAAGLHPSIGLHHSNDSNAMRLVDDLMEPFRPMIDLKVWQLNKAGETSVSNSAKRHMVLALYDDMQTEAGLTPVIGCIQKLATSVAQIYLGEKSKPELPLHALPILMTGIPID